MKYFAVDKNRSKLVVPVEFYQMNVQAAVDQARKNDPELFVDGDDTLPLWSKFAKNPLKAKGFWTRMLQAAFLGQNNLPQIDVDRQVGVIDNAFRVAMMFLPGSMTNAALKDAVKLTEQTLRGWRVLEISGVGRYNGKKITNKNAEKVTRTVIEECKESNTPVLILSRGMAQRSYSIGEITWLFLCYDSGDAGATTQKISRALTPSGLDKIGRIFSLSFDPNRDDKFDLMMITAAKNIAERTGIEIDKALRKVIDTIDIFACGVDGSSLINSDQYLQQILDRNSVSRMVPNVNLLSFQEALDLFKSGNKNYKTLDKTKTADKGRIGPPKPGAPRNQMDKSTLKILDHARKVLTTITEHLPYLVIMTGTETIRDSIDICMNNSDYSQYVRDEFGVTPDTILDYFDRGVLNYNLACLQKTAMVNDLRVAA